MKSSVTVSEYLECKVQEEYAKFLESPGLEFDNAHYLKFTGYIPVIN